jgi:hypothetical protein
VIWSGRFRPQIKNIHSQMRLDIEYDMSNFEEFKASMNQFKLIFKTTKGHGTSPLAEDLRIKVEFRY